MKILNINNIGFDRQLSKLLSIRKSFSLVLFQLRILLMMLKKMEIKPY